MQLLRLRVPQFPARAVVRDPLGSSLVRQIVLLSEVGLNILEILNRLGRGEDRPTRRLQPPR